jgi:hypothetical protein
MSATPLRIVQTTGLANYLGEANGNRRFWPVQPPQLHEFRIKVPGHSPFHGLFPNAQAARLQAEQIYPNSHPASVVCTSRQRKEARP